MSFAYSCFISYCHGQHELTRRFMTDLSESLSSSLEPFLDEPVFIDQDRLVPGFRFNVTLARAICRSVAMIVVYTPRYRQHDYCLREFAAMQRIEDRRRQVTRDRERGVIIPIIFRGRRDDLPDPLRRHIHCADFSRYTTADVGIRSNREYIDQVDQIAEYIYQLYQLFNPLADALCGNCDRFSMPRVDSRAQWTSRSLSFPGRQTAVDHG